MNLQLQQSWIDPATGDTVYMDMGGNMTGWLDANMANQGAGPGAGHHQSPYGVGAPGGHPQAHGGFMDHQSSTVQLQLEQQLQKMMSTVPLQLQMQAMGGNQGYPMYDNQGPLGPGAGQAHLGGQAPGMGAAHTGQ